MLWDTYGYAKGFTKTLKSSKYSDSKWPKQKERWLGKANTPSYNSQSKV